MQGEPGQVFTSPPFLERLKSTLEFFFNFFKGQRARDEIDTHKAADKDKEEDYCRLQLTELYRFDSGRGDAGYHGKLLFQSVWLGQSL